MTSLTHRRPQAIQSKFSQDEKALVQQAAEYSGIPMATIMRDGALAFANQLLKTPKNKLPQRITPRPFSPSEFKSAGD